MIYNAVMGPNNAFRMVLTLFYSERPKLHRVLAILSAIGINSVGSDKISLVGLDCLLRPVVPNA